MRELENKYDNAHGSSDPPLVTTFEPEVREDKRGNEEAKPWYKKIIDFLKNIWEWYRSSLKAFVEGFELGPAGVRVLTGFLIVFVLALVLLVITFVIMGISKMIKTSRENVVIKEVATAKFEDKIANMETEGDMNKILKELDKLDNIKPASVLTKPVTMPLPPPKPEMVPEMPPPMPLPTPKPEMVPEMPPMLPEPKPEPLPVPRLDNYEGLGISQMRFNELAKNTYTQYSRSGLLGSMGFKEFVDEYKEALREMRN